MRNSLSHEVVGGGAKLHAVRPVVDPMFARVDELAGTDRRGMADDGDQVALSARLHSQDAKAAVLVVKGNAAGEFSRSAADCGACCISGGWNQQ